MYGTRTTFKKSFFSNEMEKNKLYPDLPSSAAIPSAPPDPIVFRLETLRQYEKEVKNDIIKRRHSYKKYAKAHSVIESAQVVCSTISAASSTAGIATAFTVIGLPVAAVLTGAAAFSGFIALASSPALRYIANKKKKHDRFAQILKIFLINLNDKISKFVKDGNLSDEEFTEITGMYLRVKDELRAVKSKQQQSDAAKTQERINTLQKNLDKLK